MGPTRKRLWCWIVAAMLLGACHHSSSKRDPGGAVPHVVGGAVSGLEGGAIVLRLNGAQELTLTQNGPFHFATALADGTAYEVTIQDLPTNPAQDCVLANGSGRVAGKGVEDVAVTCTKPPAPTHTVGGTLTGLLGSGLVLRLDGSHDLPISVSGPFRFAEPLEDGASYEVTVRTQPTRPAQVCTVANGSGRISGEDVGNVQVSCVTTSTPTYTVGGALTGLEGSGLVLRLNGGGDLPLDADGDFTFANALADGSAYTVAVFTQPTEPDQHCTVQNGAGHLSGGNVTNVRVSCVTMEGAFLVSGSLSGLEESVGLVLQNDGSDDLRLDADGSFTFSTPIPDGGAYRVTVHSQPSNPALECRVMNGTGTIAGADVEDVEVVCRGWRGPTRVENQSGHAGAAQLAFGPDGEGIAVWTQVIAGSAQVLSSRLQAGSWSTPVRLDSQGFPALAPRLAIDPSGDAIAVWPQENAGGVAHLWANRYTKAGGGWSTAEQLETGAGAVGSAQVAVDSDGHAFVVWTQRVDATFGAPYDIWARELDPDLGWHPAQQIESNPGSAVFPTIRIDGSGNAIVAWHQHNGAVYDIWTARREAGGDWGAPVLLESDDTGNATFPELAVNANGDAVAVWHFSEGTGTHVFAARYDPGAGSWGSPIPLDASNEDATFPDVTVDPSGRALAVWRQTGSANAASVWAASFDPGTGTWSTAARIASGGIDSGSKGVEVETDPDGNAVAVYHQFTGGSAYHVFANRYVRGEGWGAQSALETDSLSATSPQVAFDAQGKSVAIWIMQDDSGYRSVYASEYR